MSRKGRSPTRHSKFNSVDDGLDVQYAVNMQIKLISDLSDYNAYKELDSSGGLSRYIRLEDSDLRIRISNHLPFGYPSKMSESGNLPDYTLELHEGMGGTREITINGVTVKHYHRDDYDLMIQDIKERVDMSAKHRFEKAVLIDEVVSKFKELDDSGKMSVLSYFNEDDLMPHNYYIGIKLDETSEEEDSEFLKGFQDV